MAAILLTSVAIDIEPIYCLATHSCPLHGFLHTYAGATILAIVAIPIIFVAKKPLQKLSAHLRVNQTYSISTIAAGAIIGAWSHVFLDSILYFEINPFSPLFDGNPFLGMFGGMSEVYLVTIIGFLAGAVIYFLRLRKTAIPLP